MLANVWMKYVKQSLELVHLNPQHFKLLKEDLLEPHLHQILKNDIGIVLIERLEVDVSRDIVHTLVNRDVPWQ